MMKHKHETISEETQGYKGSVAVHPFTAENRKAHGGVCIIETCACGATRRTNSNGRHDEVGPWQGGGVVRLWMRRGGSWTQCGIRNIHATERDLRAAQESYPHAEFRLAVEAPR